MSLLRDLQQLHGKLRSQRTALDSRIDSVARVIKRIEGLRQTDAFHAAMTAKPILVKQDGMIAVAQLHDTATYYLADKPELGFKIEDLVLEKDFLAALAEGCARNNLKAIWTEALTDIVMATSTDFCEDQEALIVAGSESLNLAEGRHEEYGVTTLSFAFQAARKKSLQTTSTHIVVNKKTQQALVVGESKLSRDMKKAIEAAGVTYVSRHDADASVKIEKVISGFLAHIEEPRRHFLKNRLCEASFYRFDSINGIDTARYVDPAISDVLAGKVDVTYPKYVVKPRN